jgi:hypothetical protein
MAIKASDTRRLDAIFAECGPKYRGRKEDYFRTHIFDAEI